MRKIMVGGVFSVIHPGHIYFLKESKKYGDYLIVVIATDKTAGKKAVFPAEIRKKLVESLDFVDKVVIGSDNDHNDIIRKEKPDIIVLGYDQNMKIENVPVERIGKFRDFNTKMIIEKLKKNKN